MKASFERKCQQEQLEELQERNLYMEECNEEALKVIENLEQKSEEQN